MSIFPMSKYLQDRLAKNNLTSALKLPAGTTSQRPSATSDPPVANGMVRYNTTTNKFEAREAGAWTNLIGSENDATITALAALTGAGIVAFTATDTPIMRAMAATANQLEIANPQGVLGNPTYSIASNPIIPGTARIKVPAGTTGQRPGTPVAGDVRFNSDASKLEFYTGVAWETVTSA